MPYGKKKICLDGLKKVLNPKEMKNVLGGSGGYRCCCGMGTNIWCEDDRDNDWVEDNCPDGIGGCFLPD